MFKVYPGTVGRFFFKGSARDRRSIAARGRAGDIDKRARQK